MNTLSKIIVFALLTTVASFALADSSAHGIGDGTQLNAKLGTTTKQPDTPYQLSDMELDTLANDILWQRLLLFRHGKSQIEQGEFFLANDGSTNAKSELIATLNAMQNKDKATICRLPARVHFLNNRLQQLGIDSQISSQSCQAFQDWLHQLDGQALSLVFAEEHPNVLASAFAHVFLKLDTKKSQKSGQNKDAVAINYSSIHPQPSPNPALLAIKSTIGGFDGGIEFLNFEQKQNEYLIDNERDIWQYRLDLTPEQVQQILRHIWETKNIARPYFFSHNNCATEIVRLVDVVRADKHIASAVGNIVIPAKIVRILDKHGMIQSQHFIPSAATKRQAKLNKPNFSLTKLQANDNNPISAAPTHRLGLSVGVDDRHQQKTTYGLSLRSAYHDLLDRPKGVRKFLELKFLSLDVRHDGEKLKIQDATIFATRSYNPSNSAKNNAKAQTGKQAQAWGLDIGLTQAIDASAADNSDHLVFNIRQEKGKSWVFGTPAHTGDLPNTLCYVLGGWGGQLGNINQGYRLGASIHAGCAHYASDTLRITTELSVPFWYHHDRANNRSYYLQPSAKASVQYDINRRHALRLTSNVQKNHQDTHHQLWLAYLTYF